VRGEAERVGGWGELMEGGEGEGLGTGGGLRRRRREKGGAKEKVGGDEEGGTCPPVPCDDPL